LTGRQPLVVGAQPPNEVENLGIAPHPRGEPLEAAQRLLGIGVASGALDVATDTVGVRPVTLDCDGSEPALLDQSPGDPRPLPIEVVGPVAGLTEEHEAGVTYELEQSVVVGLAALQRARVFPYSLKGGRFSDGQSQRRGHSSPHP
jgi:hypothetical protein